MSRQQTFPFRKLIIHSLIGLSVLAGLYLILFQPFRTCSEASIYKEAPPFCKPLPEPNETFDYRRITPPSVLQLDNLWPIELSQSLSSGYWHHSEDILILKEDTPETPYFQTADFKQIIPLNFSDKNLMDTVSSLAPDLKKALTVPGPDRIRIVYDDGSVWQPEGKYRFTSHDWSPDSRFITLYHDEQTIILDTANRSSHHLQLFHPIGAWSPRHNRRIVSVPEDDGERLCLLEYEPFRYIPLNREPSLATAHCLWNPDGIRCWIVAEDLMEYDSSRPNQPGIPNKGYRDFFGSNFFITPDGRYIQFIIHRRPVLETLVTRPKTYAVRLNLKTGAVQKIKVASSNAEVLWLKPDRYLYVLHAWDHNSKRSFQYLFQAILKWKK